MASISAELLKEIIADQREEKILPEKYYHRTSEAKLESLAKNKEIIVFTGMRRSGKSVLMHYLRQKAQEKDYYFNFEDERLARFTADDFQLLYKVFLEIFGEQNTFYFDEIQNIPGWEMFVRRLYNNGNKIFITGSNATLFSDELGSRLTGRYIRLDVYPFSFYEYASFEIPDLPDILNSSVLSTKQIARIKKIFNNFCTYGGIPEYTKNHQVDYLHSLYESIIYRDIVVRYKLTNATALKQLVFFLASNCSKETTLSSLRKLLGLGSTTTVSDYCSYLESSYLCFFLNRYNPSVKAQQLSPKKIYFIDHAFARILGFRFSDDWGRMLENIVFIELKRRNHTIFYHREQKECDFLIQEGNKITAAIQVCQMLAEPKTKQRETDGLIEALELHSLKKGYILTDSEEYEEKIKKGTKHYQICVMPIWKWFIQF